MTNIVAKYACRGVRLYMIKDQLKFTAKKGTMNPDLLTSLKKDKELIVVYLTPHFDERGGLIIALDSDARFHHWKEGGQTLRKTLERLGASPDILRRYLSKAKTSEVVNGK